jgi:hypothetical protein
MTLRPVPIEQARLAARTGGSLLGVIVVDGDQRPITIWGRTRTECQALPRWSERAGDDVGFSITAWAAPKR